MYFTTAVNESQSVRDVFHDSPYFNSRDLCPNLTIDKLGQVFIKKFPIDEIKRCSLERAVLKYFHNMLVRSTTELLNGSQLVFEL